MCIRDSLTGLYKLCTVYTRSVKLNLHVFTTDDLTLKCGSKCNRDIYVCNLDLDVAGLERSRIELFYLRLLCLLYTSSAALR